MSGKDVGEGGGGGEPTSVITMTETETQNGSSNGGMHGSQLTTSGADTRKEEVNQAPPVRKLTPYERLSHDLNNDARCLKEVTLGKRIGFYRIRGELGSGNFSQVKLGIHALTKGKSLSYLYFI